MNIDLKKHIALTSAGEVKQICQPLFDFLGINYFSFHRTYNDGSKIRLCTNPEWTEHYIKRNYIQSGRLERHPTIYKSGYSLWDYWPKDDVEHLVIKDARDNFNRDHGFSIVKNWEGYVDIYNLTTNINHGIINNAYLNYLRYIEKFTIYFMNKAFPLIEVAEKSKFIPEMDKSLFFSDDHSGLVNIEQEQKIFSLLNLEGVRIKAYNKNTNQYNLLTPRESLCAILLCRGKTAKMIAQKLNISPRTVESFINILKNKMAVYSKEEVIRNVYECEENHPLIVSPYVFFQ